MNNNSIYIVYFISGLVSLVYQTVWLRELGLVFGNSVTSSSITISLFFSGLALGSWFFSKDRFKNISRIKIYIYLEFTIGILALFFFPLKRYYWDIYPELSLAFPHLKILFHTILAGAIIIPPTFFMGATFPVLGGFLGQSNTVRNNIVLILYFVNIVGACLGVFLTGFVLPQLFGFNITYGFACITNILLSFYVYYNVKSLTFSIPEVSKTEEKNAKSKTEFLFPAFLSGFIFLGIEICWFKSFSLVFQNSIYTYNSILIVVIFSIGAAALVTSYNKKHPLLRFITNNALLLSFVLSLTFPPLFILMFKGRILFDFIASNWYVYSLHLMLIVFCFIFPTAFFSSILFPLMLRVNMKHKVSQKNIGELYSLNTCGGIMGSLITGLIMIPLIGTWKSYYVLCLLYLPIQFYFEPFIEQNRKLRRSIAYALTSVAIILIFINLPPLAVKDNEKLLWHKDNNIAQVSVVMKEDDLLLKVNNSYYLGGTGDFLAEKLQTHIPLAINNNSKDIYILGLGTGITAGEVLNFKNKELLVSEINPIVIEASQLFFKPYINNLYTATNAKVIADDGRTILYGSKKYFDVIIADLFVTWNRGVGNLYSEEHFRKASLKLNDFGIYVQWLPFYNFFREEFWSIVKTMNKVFPRVTMWQLMLRPDNIVVGLIGHKSTNLISKDEILNNLLMYNKINLENKEAHYLRVLSYFYGDLSNCKTITNNFKLNTEDYPFIEFHSPKSAIKTINSKRSFLLGNNFLKLENEIENNCVNRLSYLQNIPDKDIAIGGRHKLIYNIKKRLKIDNSKERDLLESKIGIDRHKLILKAESEI